MRQRGANQPGWAAAVVLAVVAVGEAVAARAVPGSRAAEAISAAPPRMRRLTRKVSFIDVPLLGRRPVASAFAWPLSARRPALREAACILLAAAAGAGRGAGGATPAPGGGRADVGAAAQAVPRFAAPGWTGRTTRIPPCCADSLQAGKGWGREM